MAQIASLHTPSNNTDSIPGLRFNVLFAKHGSLAELEGVVLPLPLQPGPVLVAEVRQAKAPLHGHERPHCSNHVAETRGEAQILD